MLENLLQWFGHVLRMLAMFPGNDDWFDFRTKKACLVSMKIRLSFRVRLVKEVLRFETVCTWCRRVMRF